MCKTLTCNLLILERKPLPMPCVSNTFQPSRVNLNCTATCHPYTALSFVICLYLFTSACTLCLVHCILDLKRKLTWNLPIFTLFCHLRSLNTKVYVNPSLLFSDPFGIQNIPVKIFVCDMQNMSLELIPSCTLCSCTSRGYGDEERSVFFEMHQNRNRQDWQHTLWNLRALEGEMGGA